MAVVSYFLVYDKKLISSVNRVVLSLRDTVSD